MEENQTAQFDRLPGKIIEMQHLQKLSLSRDDCIWIIIAGELDLFLVDKMTGMPTDEHESTNFTDIDSISFLTSVKEGRLLFPFALKDSNTRVQAISFGKTVVKQIQIETLRTDQINSEVLHAFNLQLQQWIDTLASQFNHNISPRYIHFLEPSGSFHFERLQSLALSSSSNDTIWIEVKDGAFIISGKPSLIIEPTEPPFPFSSKIWLEAKENGTLETIQPIDWISQIKFWKGILLFNQYVVTAAKYHTVQNALQKRSDMAFEQVYEKQQILQTLGRIESVSLGESVSKGIESSNDLMMACHYIGEVQKINFVEPSVQPTEDIEKQIKAVADSSNLYYRSTALPSNWWKIDCGPLLGYLKGDEGNYIPVALLHLDHGGYEMIIYNQRFEVGPSEAARLLPVAYQFYRFFPKKIPLSMKDILQIYSTSGWRDLYSAIFAGILTIVTNLLGLVAISALFNYAIPYVDMTLFWQIFFGLILTILSGTLFLYTREVAIQRLETWKGNELQFALWQRVFELPNKVFHQIPTANFYEKIARLTYNLRKVMGDPSRAGVNALFGILYFVGMLYFSPTLSIIAIPLLLFSGLLILLRFKRLFKEDNEKEENQGDLFGMVAQMLQGISKIKSSGAESRVFNQWAKQLYNIQRSDMLRGNSSLLMRLFEVLFPLISMMGFMIILALMFRYLKLELPINQGDFIAFLIAFAICSTALFNFQHASIPIVYFFESLKSLRNLLNIPSEVDEKNVMIKLGPLNGEVKIDHLNFHYEGNPNFSLQEIDLNAYSGEYIAIVGPLDSGKSTLIRMLLGFEKPLAGHIFYNGHDLSELDFHEIRSQLGVVMQDSVIINGTMRDFIDGGRHLSEEEISSAAQQACLKLDPTLFPEGLSTYIYQEGANLSFGQKQLLLLARALAGDPKLLLLDGVFDCLDDITRKTISHNLQSRYVTRIVTTRNIDTVRLAHRIYLIEEGKIVNVGTFSELQSHHGLMNEPI